MTYKKLGGRLATMIAILAFIGLNSYLLFGDKIKGVNEVKDGDISYNGVSINDRGFILEDSITFTCARCGYPNGKWIRMIVTASGKVDSVRSGLFKKQYGSKRTGRWQ